MIKVSCECGKVWFEFEIGCKEIIVCYCSQCCKISGYFWVVMCMEFVDLWFILKDILIWYLFFEWVCCGFCLVCGLSLFYQMKDEIGVGIVVGCLDNLFDDFKVVKYIFVKDKGCYYDINDLVIVLDSY